VPSGGRRKRVDGSPVENPKHQMDLVQRNGEEMLFVCPVESCRRRLVLGSRGEMTILERGDFFASHSGGTPGLEITSSVAS
jgi:hypothetical protein